MKQQQKVDIYRIEYEIMPKMTHYSACIAAESHESALEHLGKVMGRAIHVISSGIVCPLHDLTPAVRQMLTGVGTQKTKTEKPAVEETDTFKSGRGRKPAPKE